jgi:hypothetical protein
LIGIAKIIGRRVEEKGNGDTCFLKSSFIPAILVKIYRECLTEPTGKYEKELA